MVTKKKQKETLMILEKKFTDREIAIECSYPEILHDFIVKCASSISHNSSVYKGVTVKGDYVINLLKNDISLQIAMLVNELATTLVPLSETFIDEEIDFLVDVFVTNGKLFSDAFTNPELYVKPEGIFTFDELMNHITSVIVCETLQDFDNRIKDNPYTDMTDSFYLSLFSELPSLLAAFGYVYLDNVRHSILHNALRVNTDLISSYRICPIMFINDEFSLAPVIVYNDFKGVMMNKNKVNTDFYTIVPVFK